MTDRMHAEIFIGGKISRDKLRELSEALIAEGVLDFEPAEVADVLLYLLEASASGVCVGGMDNEADWGRFEDLEAKCRELGLTYGRSSDPKYEYDGEYVYCSPTTGRLRWQQNASGHIVFTADELKELLPADATDTQLRAGHSRLLELLDVPEAPPLEIVD